MFTSFRAIALSAAATMLLLVTHAVSFGQTVGAGEMQTWMDESLTHKIVAKYKGMEGDLVMLETADGSIKKIAYAKLSLSSQLKAKKYSDPKIFDAPPLPSTFSAPPLSESPFSADDSIEKYLETKFKLLSEGHADVLWHSLPPSSQADLEGCIVRFAEIVGPNTFKQVQAILPNLHTVIRDKRSFIVGSPAVAAQPEFAKLVNQGLPALEPLVAVLTKPATWNSENFKEGKVGPWLMLFGNDALAASKGLRNFLRPFAPGADLDVASAKVKVLEKTADAAKVEITTGASKMVASYKKVDGHWIDDADKFPANLATLKTYLNNLDQAGKDELKNRVRDNLTVMGGVVGGLAKTRTQQEFAQLFDSYAAMGVRMYMMAANGMRQNGQGMQGQQQRMNMADGMSGVSSQSQ